MRYNKLDIVKEIVFLIFMTAFIFAWWMLMLLIISFMTSSYLHFSIEGMLIASIVLTVIIDIQYILKKIKEYRKRSAH